MKVTNCNCPKLSFDYFLSIDQLNCWFLPPGYGVFSDGKIIYINASTCDINYIPKNLPIVFDVPLPEGQCKN